MRGRVFPGRGGSNVYTVDLRNGTGVNPRGHGGRIEPRRGNQQLTDASAATARRSWSANSRRLMIQPLSRACLTEIPVSVSSSDAASTSGRIAQSPAQTVEPPAWTETNQSDPGMTLVELFSWVDSFVVYGGPRDLADPLRHVAVEAGMAGGLPSDPPS
jgi:hypothetical protein